MERARGAPSTVKQEEDRRGEGRTKKAGLGYVWPRLAVG